MTKSFIDTVFIIYDSKTKALLLITNDEKLQLKTLRTLILNDMNNEKTDLEMKILKTDDKEEAQILKMTVVQLEQQENNKNLRSYILNDKVVNRYYLYSKELNNTDTKIFFN